MYGCDGLTTDSKGRVYISVDQVGQVMMVLPPGDKGRRRHRFRAKRVGLWSIHLSCARSVDRDLRG